jgi:hypothetical protein
MLYKKLNWILMVLLVPSLILGLVACSGQSESEAPPVTTALEKETKAPTPTEETAATEVPAVKEKAVETPTPTEEATATEEGEDTTVDSRPDASAFTIDDWPIPPEAEEVEFIIGGELTYLVAWDMETVVKFYRPTFEHLGLETDCLDDVGEYTSKSCSVSQNNLVVNFSLHKSNDKSTVQIDFHNYALEDDSAAAETGAETADLFNVGDIIEMENLSLVVDEVTSPAEIGYQPDAGNKFLKIVFTIENRHSSAKIDAFSLWMTIKDPAENIYYNEGLGFRDVDDTGDLFGSHTGRIAPAEKARGGTNFQVPVDAAELVLVIDAAELGGGKVFVALPETEAPQMDDSVPDALAANIPAFLIPTDAQDVVYDADLAEISYTSPSDVETVVEFYRQSLPVEGWQEDETFSTVDETFALVMFNQGADSFNINIISTDITEVTVDISFAPSLAEIIEGGTSTETETAPSDSGPLSLVEEEGFPVPSNYEYLSTMESPFAIIVTFGSPSELDTLVELYETELPGQGWEFIEHSLDGDVARLYFENSDQKLSIDLRVNDGEISPDLAGQTSVELTVKDPVAAAEAGILPPPGQARILLLNSAEVDLTATINQQEIKLTPIPMSTEFPEDPPSIDLPPGQYTFTISAPDGNVTSYDIEIGLDKEIAPGEVWAFILDVGMSPMEWPVY